MQLQGRIETIEFGQVRLIREIEDKIQEQEAPAAEEPQEETDAPLEEADKIILNEDDTQDIDE